MKSSYRHLINAADESRAMHNRQPVSAAPQAPGSGAVQSAASSSKWRRKRADRLAIERAEDEGMTVRPA